MFHRGLTYARRLGLAPGSRAPAAMSASRCAAAKATCRLQRVSAHVLTSPATAAAFAGLPGSRTHRAGCRTYRPSVKRFDIAAKATAPVWSRDDLKTTCHCCGHRARLCEASNPAPGVHICPECGPSGTLSLDLDMEAARGSHGQTTNFAAGAFNISRYATFLPVPFPEELTTSHSIQIGWTPLLHGRRLNSVCGFPESARVWIKDESRQASGSFKDRASLVAVLDAIALGQTTVATASTGNAASSLATICASLGLRSVIFVPHTAPAPKLAQLQMCGAEIVLVDGTYDDAVDLCTLACQKHQWYNRSTGVNPFTIEGKKTCSLEIWEQLGQRAPDHVYVSVGDGCIIAGIGKGFADLLHAGLIQKLPKIHGVQTVGSSVLSQGAASRTITPQDCDTYADSISVSKPSVAHAAWQAVASSGGSWVQVTDSEIQQAARILASRTGVFGEPSGSTPLAGMLRHAEEKVCGKADENIVLIMSGSGMKDVKGALAACPPLPAPIAPTLEALASHFTEEK